MDFVLAAFPSILLWNIQMKTTEKIGVVVAMSLGILYVCTPPPAGHFGFAVLTWSVVERSGITGSIKTSYVMEMGRWTDFTC